VNQAKNRALSGLAICILFLTMLLQYSCMAATALKGKKGLDVSTVKVGMSKADAEKSLGPPVREWVTSSGILYRVYDYDAGMPPSGGDAAAHVFMDVATAGVWEIFGAFGAFNDLESRKREQMAVSYDVNDMVIGVFDHFGDFDILPADGHADK